MNRNKRYSELAAIAQFRDRYHYLRLFGQVGKQTFGSDRYLNQAFYTSSEWRRVRDQVIVRDNGCDLGHPDYPILGKIIVHHLNPIYAQDLESMEQTVLNPDNLVCVSHNTHEAIHYGDEGLLITEPIIRAKHDTCPWRKP